MRKAWALVVIAVACSAGSVTAVKPSTHGAGAVHFELVRSLSGSIIPPAADSVLVRVRNPDGFDSVIARLKLPAPGTTTEVSGYVPADTGYVAMLLAFHGSTMDAVGSSYTPESSLTVLPVGQPGNDPPPTTVHIGMQPLSIHIEDHGGTFVAHMPSLVFLETYGAPYFFDPTASCSWGCGGLVNGMTIAAYQSLAPDTPGPWDLYATIYADGAWGASLSFTSDTVHATVTPAQGQIIVTFNKTKQH